MADYSMAQRIKDLRLAKGLTLEQVASVVGVGKSTVRKWETGMIANMRRDKIASLAQALGVTPEYLMGWDDSLKLKQFIPDKPKQDSMITKMQQFEILVTMMNHDELLDGLAIISGRLKMMQTENDQ